MITGTEPSLNILPSFMSHQPKVISVFTKEEGAIGLTGAGMAHGDFLALYRGSIDCGKFWG